MKKIISVLLLLLMLNSYVIKAGEIKYFDKVANSEADIPISKTFVLSGGMAVIEAEDATLSKDASIVSAVGSSGDKAVQITPQGATAVDNADAVAEPTISFRIYALNYQYASYNVWVRAKTPSATAESYFTKTSDKPSYTVQYHRVNPNYFWRSYPIKITDSVFEFCIKYRREGVVFDKFIVTNDFSFVPEGADDLPKFDPESDNHDGSVYPIPKETPPKGHPRIMATKEILPELRANKEHPLLKQTYENVKKLAFAQISGKLPDKGNASNSNDYLCFNVQCRAYVYLMGEADEKYGKETIAIMRDMFKTVKWNPGGSTSDTRPKGIFMATAAIVYDWCYDLLTEEDKRFFVDEIIKLATVSDVGYPPYSDEITLSGTSGEGGLFYSQLTAALAIYDEYPDMYNIVGGKIITQLAPAREYFFKTGSHPEGNAYAGTRYQWEALCKVLFDRIGYPDVMGPAKEAAKPAYRFIYDRLPPGFHFEDGDNYLYWNKANGPYYYTNDIAGQLFASYFDDDPYLRGEYIKQLSTQSYKAQSLLCGNSVQTLMLFDPKLPYKYPGDEGEELPLTYASSYPITDIFMRTSWQAGSEGETAAVFMKGQEKFIGGHQHADIGNFEIYYKGMLAINAGIYEGQNGGYASSHHFNYHKRTISKNCITVFDPDEKFTSEYGEYAANTLSNDGGQEFNDLRGTHNLKEFIEYEDDAKTEGLYIGPNKNTPVFSYLKTNLANAYSDKVKAYTRSMVAINLFNTDYPLAFICYDDVTSSNSAFKKTWNLQTVDQPQTKGDTTVVTRSNYDFTGKLVVKTMLPEKPVFENVGGEGKESYVNGKNYPNPDKVNMDMEQGDWRMEISPATPAEKDLFLNTMYVTDKEKNLPELPMIKEEMGGFVGATVMNNTVLFFKDGGKTDKEFELSVRNNGYDKVNVFVTDVLEGNWTVSGNGIKEVYKVSAEENALYMELKPGKYTVTKTDDSTEVEERVYSQKKNEAPVGDFLTFDATHSRFYYNESPAVSKDNVHYLGTDFMEKLGCKVERNGNSVTISKGINKISLNIGSKDAKINENSVTLSGAPFEESGILYVATEDFGEVTGYKFAYDSLARIMHITKSLVPDAYYEAFDVTKMIVPAKMTGAATEGKVENLTDLNFATQWVSDDNFVCDLGEKYNIDSVYLSAYSGKMEISEFDILVSDDNVNYKMIYSGNNSGKSEKPEKFKINAYARYIKVLCRGTSNAFSEFAVLKK